MSISYKDALSSLRASNEAFTEDPLQSLNELVLIDPGFYISPGGSEHHHNYKHGLVIHVHEVMSNVLSMTDSRPSEELVTAVVWHDYMKVRDYSLGENGEVIKNLYRKLINHVTGSAMEFHRCAFGLIKTEQLECIEHLMLSHHGRKEWGSPVEPLTAEAFILHAADMMSAKGNNL